MAAKPSEYHRPATVEEAFQLTKSPQSIAIAGGAFAFAMLRLPYERVIDLQDIDELRRIEKRESYIHLGSAVTLQAVVETDSLPSSLQQTLKRAIPPNRRRGASIGESLLFPQHCPEWITALIALNAEVELLMQGAERATFSIVQVIEGRTDDTQPFPFITGLDIPVIGLNEALGTACVARTPAGEPIINAGVYVALDENGKITQASAAIFGASETPFTQIELAITGYPLDESSIRGAVELVVGQVDPVDDYKGSAEYRREMAGVCARRALQACGQKTGG